MNNFDYINLNFRQQELNTKLDMYLKFMIISGLFYLLPSIQFVFFQSINTNSNNNIKCYYNFKCKHDLSVIPAFNNIISNLLYCVFGFVYIIIVRFKNNSINGYEDIGIYKNKSLYYSLGICLILEGVSSSFYHLCPSIINLQFDTTFMFVGILYSFLTLFNKRHAGELCEPLKFYTLVFMLIIFNMLSLVNKNNTQHMWFWVVVFSLTTYTLVFTSLYIYSNKLYDLDIKSARIFISYIKTTNFTKNPKFWLVMVSNLFTVSMLVYASFTKPYFTGWMLFIGVVNLCIYFVFYLICKLINREHITRAIKILIAIDIISLVLSLYFYYNTNYNTFISIEDSNKLNKECILFGYFDDHDMWHFLSSISLFIFIIIILFIDYDIEYEKNIIVNNIENEKKKIIDII